MAALRSIVFVLAMGVLASSASAQYTYGQATYYNSIDHGYCGYGQNIPANGFVAAWPFIETGPNGQGYPQPGSNGCGTCFEVSCVPQMVESADGSIYLDRRDACADPNRAVVVRIVDECRCSIPRDTNLPRGNFNWCCNTDTPRLKINRHLDLSQQAFTALVKDGNYGLGIIGIRWRPTSCSRIGVVGLNDANSVTTPIINVPATQPAAAAAPERPNTTPPKDTNGSPNWHAVEGLHTEEARDNTQELPLLSQCGGTGGDCRKYGPGNVCRDSVFPGYSCARGLECLRQSEYYHQCVAKDRNNIDPDGRYAVRATSNNKPQSSQTPPQTSTTTPSPPSSPSSNQAPNQAPSQSNPPAKAPPATTSPVQSTPQPNPAPQAPKTLAQGQQCGGKGAACADLGGCDNKPVAGVTCATGLVCTAQNEWYWECTKPSSGSNTAAPPAPTAPSNPAPGTKPAPTTSNNTPPADSNSNKPPADPKPQQSSSPSPQSSSVSNTGARSTVVNPRIPSGVIIQYKDQQCGGLGNVCSQLGDCCDGEARGVACDQGLTCKRQDSQFWSCQ